ncbi:MAG TPA: alpha/beta hydrolase [Anaerolineae bacterium]|nr:alpha/beta hydrolase [Anaerolineae bacterium]
MYYEIHGEGEPLIVLHGSADSIETMRNAIVPLAEQYRVIAVDTRGHGRSTDSDHPFSYDLFAKDIIELMDLLEIDRAHIVGLSDGGITGLTIAMTYPDRLDRLVAVGANASPEGLTEIVVEGMRYGAFFESTPSYAYQRHAPDPSHWRNLTEKLRHMILSEPNFTQDDLAKIQAPVLVMIGENDRFIRIDHTEGLHRMIANSTLFIVPKAGHNVFEVGQQGQRGVVDTALDAILTFLAAH